MRARVTILIDNGYSFKVEKPTITQARLLAKQILAQGYFEGRVDGKGPEVCYPLHRIKQIEVGEVFDG